MDDQMKNDCYGKYFHVKISPSHQPNPEAIVLFVLNGNLRD